MPSDAGRMVGPPPSADAGSRAWWALAVLLAVGSVLAPITDARALDWQPDAWLAQPWRWWSAAWVHWSNGHRWANLLGTLLIAALGWRARCDRPDALAWFLAWPLTHLGLLWQPELRHYGGLSGVLHAGVVVAACGLVQRERGTRRLVGAAIVLGVALKVWSEQPWQGALRSVPGWDIALAPAAHLSGAAAGALCAAGAALWRRLAAQGAMGRRHQAPR